MDWSAGAQDPFVQIGTLENEYSLPAGGHFRVYVAFWSDTEKHYEPQYFATVRPGDQIVVSMTASRTGWKLAFDDRTDANVVVLGNPEPPAGYIEGEWLQEDPGGGVPYPGLGSVTFSDLEINNKRPALNFADAQSLTTPDARIFGPSNVVDDQFSVSSIIPNNVQRQLLVDVAATDRLGSKLAVEEEHWLLPPTARQAVAAAAPYLAAETNSLHDLEAQRWPDTALPALRTFTTLDAETISCVRQLDNAEPTPALELVARCEGLASAASNADLALRRTLGLPAPAPYPSVGTRTRSTSSAENLVASALASLRSARSVHVTMKFTAIGSDVPPKSASTLVGLDADLFAGGDVDGTVQFATSTRRLVVVGRTIYQRLSGASLERLLKLPVTVADPTSRNWLVATTPLSGKYASLGYSDNDYSLNYLESVLEGLGPLTDVGTGHVDGKQAILLRSTSGSSLWVAANAVHSPIQASVLTGYGERTISFEGWNQASPPTSPSPTLPVTLVALLH